MRKKHEQKLRYFDCQCNGCSEGWTQNLKQCHNIKDGGRVFLTGTCTSY